MEIAIFVGTTLILPSCGATLAILSLSLRSEHPAIHEVKERGYKVNMGFVVEHDGVWREGDEAFGYLNSFLRKGGILQLILAGMSTNQFVSKISYRFLVLARYMVLLAQGLTLINLGDEASDQRYQTISRLTRIGLLLSILLIAYSIYDRLHGADKWAVFYTLIVFCGSCGFYYWLILRHRNLEGLLRKLDIGGWLAFSLFLLYFLILVNAVDPLVTRRFIGVLLCVPVIGLLFRLARVYGRKTRKAGPLRFFAWVPVATLLFAVVPGFIAGPFYSGIAGWVIRANEEDPIRITGLKLINASGDAHWLPPAVFQPHGQIGRFERAFLAIPGESAASFVKFAFETYVRIYPQLEKGKFPHQWALGDVAYPTHSLQKYNTEQLAAHFAPEDVVRIDRMVEVYDISGNQVSSAASASYPITELIAVQNPE